MYSIVNEDIGIWVVIHDETQRIIPYHRSTNKTEEAVEEFFYWCNEEDDYIWDQWLSLSRSQRQEAKKQRKWPYMYYNSLQTLSGLTATGSPTITNCAASETPPIGWKPYEPSWNVNTIYDRTRYLFDPFLNGWVPEQKETDMYTAIATNVNSTQTDSQYQRDYLLNRARNAFDTKREQARTDFGLNDMDGPENVEEMIARIKEGKFVLEQNAKDYHPRYDGVRGIRWRDPETKEDLEGYKAFEKVLLGAFKDAKDAIIVQTAEDGLAAVKAMEDLKTV